MTRSVEDGLVDKDASELDEPLSGDPKDKGNLLLLCLRILTMLVYIRCDV